MTPAEKVEFDKLDLGDLMKLPAFNRFMFRILEASTLLRPANGTDAELRAAEGKRVMGAEILSWIEDTMIDRHISGLPVLASIQLLSAVRHETIAKEKPRRGRPGSRTDEDGADG